MAKFANQLLSFGTILHVCLLKRTRNQFKQVHQCRQQAHTAYSRNNMDQKCEGDCGLWILNEIILRQYAESLKKIVGAVWKLPAK